MDKRLPANRGAEAVLGFQPNSSISVAYHPDFGPHDELLLLELDEKLLTDVLCEKVSLRGDPDEEAVLCSQSKTYAVKFVGTSNSVFLIPPSESSLFADNQMDCDEKDTDHPALASVFKVATGSLEIVEVAPKLDKLKMLLSEKPYTDKEASEMDITSYSMEPVSGLYTWDDLTGQIQASDVELRLGLDALDALEINGYWRLIHAKYMDSILIRLLHTVVLKDWPLNAVPENDLVNTLESVGFPPIIATHCLRVYGSKVDTGSDGASLWKLDERRVCVHFAKEILKDGKMRMGKLMEKWSTMPHGIVPSFDMLEGEVLTERIGVEIWARAFSISSLPSTPAERFSVLFKERPKWEWKDLEPYIRDLKVPGLSSEGLLLKYTRRSQPTPNSEPIFSAR